MSILGYNKRVFAQRPEVKAKVTRLGSIHTDSTKKLMREARYSSIYGWKPTDLTNIRLTDYRNFFCNFTYNGKTSLLRSRIEFVKALHLSALGTSWSYDSILAKDCYDKTRKMTS